jgi:hypothetical protein
MVSDVEGIIAGFWSKNQYVAINLLKDSNTYMVTLNIKDAQMLRACSMLMHSSRMQNGPVKMIKHK